MSYIPHAGLLLSVTPAGAQQAQQAALAAHQVNLPGCVARHLELVRKVGELVDSQVDSLHESEGHQRQ
jgi:hypothetical protein